MPNYVDNVLIITGRKERLIDFRDKAVSKRYLEMPLDPYSFFPLPEPLHDLLNAINKANDDMKTYIKSEEDILVFKELGMMTFDNPVRTWRALMWGTIDPIEDGKLEEKELDDGLYQLRYVFLTRWSPITNFLYHVSNFYEDIKFEYYHDEHGMRQRGYLVIDNGIDTDYCYEEYAMEEFDERDLRKPLSLDRG